jgi:hypothetical protein
MARRKVNHQAHVPPSSPARPSTGLSVRRTTNGVGWKLVYPRCVRDRAEDILEVRAMIEAGELEIAVDELRWLLSGCSEFVEAHTLLGQLALEMGGDLPLARGHFGYGYQLGWWTVKRAGQVGPLLCSHPANQPFFLAGQGLAWCLHQLDKSHMASEIIESLITMDPSDPLELRTMFDRPQTDDLPMAQLLDTFPERDQPEPPGEPSSED